MKRKFPTKNLHSTLLVLALLVAINGVLIMPFNANASVPSNPNWQGPYRCATTDPGGEHNLHAVIQNSVIDPNLPIGSVLTTIEMQGGSWDFYCNPDSDYPTYAIAGKWDLGIAEWKTPWIGDATVCQIPGLSGIGIRYYNGGTARQCTASAVNPSIITIANASFLSGSVNFSPFAELVRIGTIPVGSITFPSSTNLYVRGYGTWQYSASANIWDLIFTNTALEAQSCSMLAFNQTIDFGVLVSSNDVISKAFDIWLTSCSAAELTAFKPNAKLSFASTRISPDGSKLNNCDDSDCAIGAYISFEDHEGDSINLNSGYLLNAQSNTSEDKLSFNANLHTDSTSGGKIETSITLVLEYL
ncbi:fimbrial protein [Shewanella fidelis]|uniref:Fimbrial protein n=1 Tax=Shewanella fidelis TaxID=173509 RepID=A0AAW8NHQ3_9GAMM|nr:hypothetical protein [Shewanella fidelis]MDR8522235.1 hypothetical protein [Shewanella fidelis]MDW4812549.1 hypothetical protein [Shewanella fidelis]MDW4816296.1 hypothetical protein [Shewanella fidelis]MDW4820790.1 hypothetical protein [Shewanella fidelis]MDW4825012.1 hypothetical protein [Shewanella fidelis]